MKPNNVTDYVTAYFLNLKTEVPASGYWSYAILDELLHGITRREVNSLEKSKLAIVVVHADNHVGKEELINAELAKVSHVVLFLMSGEEALFDVSKIEHPSIEIWVQAPRPGKHDAYHKLGFGYTPHSRDEIVLEDEDFDVPTKPLDYFFAGQVTHERRKKCVEQLELVNTHCPSIHGEYVSAPGFAQGLEPKEYIEKMAQAKVVPCPAGPHTPDTFRMYEALELGCVPIVDEQTPTHDWSGYFEYLFGQPVPFPVLSYYEQLPGYIQDAVVQYPQKNNEVQSWWMRKKFEYRCLLLNQLIDKYLVENNEWVTDHRFPSIVVVPISPIPSHPSTAILEETLESVLYQLPDTPIVLTFDGVREEQKQVLPEYQQSIRRILWKYRTHRVMYPIVFSEHMHQSGMLRDVLFNRDEVLGSYTIVYVEQDTPLVTDYDIPFDRLMEYIRIGYSNLVRFHFEAFIPDEHKHLMLGDPDLGTQLQATIQWSQRPHIASTSFYKRIMTDHFSEDSKSFIEDNMHGVVQRGWKQDRQGTWNQWRLHIYHPNGNIKRSYHTDGRSGQKKYDDTQIF